MRIGEYEMESPLMNAGGVVKTVEDVRLMAATGVGAVLAGSFTLEPRVGNSPNGEKVYDHDSETGITTNSLGMPNKGLVEVAKDLPDMIQIAHDQGKPFILNFAPVSSDPMLEIVRMSEILQRAGIDNLDGFELNASCPNVVTSDGGRHELLSRHPEQLGEVVAELRDISTKEVPFGTLIVRVSPFEGQQDALPLAESLQEAGAHAVAAFNTFPGSKPVLEVPGSVGGQSGGGMAPQAEMQTSWLVAAMDSIDAGFDIIGSNGIVDAARMKRRLNLGASTVSATTLFYEAPHGWGRAVDRMLQEYAELSG